MKKSDAEAIAIKILLMKIEQKQIIDADHNAERSINHWVKFLEEQVSDEVNLDLLKHLID